MVSLAPAQVSSAKPRPLTRFGCQSSRLPSFDLLRFHLQTGSDLRALPADPRSVSTCFLQVSRNRRGSGGLGCRRAAGAAAGPGAPGGFQLSERRMETRRRFGGGDLRRRCELRRGGSAAALHYPLIQEQPEHISPRNPPSSPLIPRYPSLVFIPSSIRRRRGRTWRSGWICCV